MGLKYEVREVVNATKEQLDIGAEVLAKAFAKDEFSWACVGHDSYEFLTDFQRSTIVACAKGGLLYFAYGENDEVLGVSAWFPPGRTLLDDPEQGKDGYDDFFKKIPEPVSKWWTEKFLPEYDDQTEGSLGAGFKVGTWHLQLLGVLPDKQRLGVGRALVEVGEKKAKAESKSVVIEAEDEENTEMFYKRIGYYVKPSGPPEHPEYRVYKDYKGDYGFKMWILLKDFN